MILEGTVWRWWTIAFLALGVGCGSGDDDDGGPRGADGGAGEARTVEVTTCRPDGWRDSRAPSPGSNLI